MVSCPTLCSLLQGKTAGHVGVELATSVRDNLLRAGLLRKTLCCMRGSLVPVAIVGTLCSLLHGETAGMQMCVTLRGSTPH